MAHYARLVEEPAVKNAVLTVARRSANFLIARNEPAGSPWQYCPPTFWDGVSVYLAKAVALANALTIAQRYWGGGEIPTHLRSVMPEPNWMTASLYTAISLMRNADLLDSLPAGGQQGGRNR